MNQRAAIYCRISADREGRELGVGRQEEDCRLRAAVLGLSIIEVYIDDDISASTKSKKNRPAYNKMLADARAGNFDVILAYTSGRLTRRPREHEDLIDLSVECGVRFEYVRSPSFDLNTAQGRQIARTLAAQDAGEAEQIAERVARQKEQAAATGLYRGGPRPFGFEADGVTVRTVEADDIRKATSAVLRGSSLRHLATELRAAGRTTSKGSEMTTTYLRRVLRRARNAGLIEVKQADGTMLVVGPATWPAIVTEAEWRAVVAVLDDPKRRTNRSNVAKRWLGTNLFICGVCGTPVRGTMAAGPGSYVYRCESGDLPDRRHVIRRAKAVDDLVTQVVLEGLALPEIASKFLYRDHVDVTGLQAQAVVLRARNEEAASLFAAGTIDGPTLTRIAADVRDQLAAVDAELTEAASGSALDGLIGENDLSAAWKGFDVARRQAIVDAVCSVTLLPAPKGRPPGWRPGTPYFSPEFVKIEWRRP